MKCQKELINSDSFSWLYILLTFQILLLLFTISVTIYHWVVNLPPFSPSLPQINKKKGSTITKTIFSKSSKIQNLVIHSSFQHTVIVPFQIISRIVSISLGLIQGNGGIIVPLSAIQNPWTILFGSLPGNASEIVLDGSIFKKCCRLYVLFSLFVACYFLDVLVL